MLIGVPVAAALLRAPKSGEALLYRGISYSNKLDHDRAIQDFTLEESFGERVFASRIRKTVRFAEAPVQGMSVLKYDPDGMAAHAYRQLAKEVLANGNR